MKRTCKIDLDHKHWIIFSLWPGSSCYNRTGWLGENTKLLTYCDLDPFWRQNGRMTQHLFRVNKISCNTTLFLFTLNKRNIYFDLNLCKGVLGSNNSGADAKLYFSVGVDSSYPLKPTAFVTGLSGWSQCIIYLYRIVLCSVYSSGVRVMVSVWVRGPGYRVTITVPSWWASLSIV